LKILIDQKINDLALPNTINENLKTDNILVISDNDSKISDVVNDTFLKHHISFQFLNSPSNHYSYNLGELMNNLKKFHTYIVINTKSDSGWISSIINLLARSKGYEGSVLDGHVGLFITNPRTGFDNSTSLSIDPIVYNQTNFVEKLELFISKVNL
jgi:hypothetical protein